MKYSCLLGLLFISACSKPSSPTANILALPTVGYVETVQAQLKDLAMIVSSPGAAPTKGWMSFGQDWVATYEPSTPLRGEFKVQRFTRTQQVAIVERPRKVTTKESPLRNEALVFEIRDGRRVANFASPANSTEAMEDLDQWNEMSQAAQSFFPNPRPKVGDEWDLSAEHARRWFGLRISKPEGKIHLRVEGVEGEALQAKISLAITGEWMEDGKSLALKLQAEGTLHRSLDQQLDVEILLKGTANLNWSDPSGQSKLSLSGPVEIEESRRLTFGKAK